MEDGGYIGVVIGEGLVDLPVKGLEVLNGSTVVGVALIVVFMFAVDNSVASVVLPVV